VREALAGALARHLDEAQRREAVDGHAGAVGCERLLELREHGVAVRIVIHVDEVDDDDPAEIAQAQLPRDDLRGLEVRLEDRVVEAAARDEAAGVHVDGRQRLGLVDDEIAAALQRDAAREGALDLVLDAVEVEQRAIAGVVLDAVRDGQCVVEREGLHALVGLARVDDDHLRLCRSRDRAARASTG
jgi:hypothetical protein